jgi:hypothetical protein
MATKTNEKREIKHAQRAVKKAEKEIKEAEKAIVDAEEEVVEAAEVSKKNKKENLIRAKRDLEKAAFTAGEACEATEEASFKMR